VAGGGACVLPVVVWRRQWRQQRQKQQHFWVRSTGFAVAVSRLLAGSVPGVGLGHRVGAPWLADLSFFILRCSLPSLMGRPSLLFLTFQCLSLRCIPLRQIA